MDASGTFRGIDDDDGRLAALNHVKMPALRNAADCGKRRAQPEQVGAPTVDVIMNEGGYARLVPNVTGRRAFHHRELPALPRAGRPA